MKTSSDASIFV